MNPGCIVKLRPLGPWRIGPDSGARDRVDTVYHADSLYSAVTGAMLALGQLEEWLDATARNSGGAAVRFSSCYPFHGDTRFVAPPKPLWPPPATAKVRWKAAKFIPLPLVESLVNGALPEEDRWSVDGASECLVPHGRTAPFRIGLRSSAAVDRLGAADPEPRTRPRVASSFTPAPDSGRRSGSPMKRLKRTLARAARKRALRLLADSGFGGERSRGWGRTEAPEFQDGALPDLILPTPSAPAPDSESSSQAYWLLSLFTPMADDTIDWQRGSYSLVERGGRVDSPTRSGDVKKLLNMVSEGSVLVASGDLRGSAADVAPDGFPHPVYRAGFALAIPIPQGVA